MDCEQAREELIELIDRARRDQGAEVGAHLEECQACQAWYQEQQRAVDALAQLQPLTVPADFKARVLAELPADRLRPRPRTDSRSGRVAAALHNAWSDLARPAARRRLVPALALAAVLLMLWGVFYISQSSQPPVTPGAAVGSTGWVAAGGLALAGVAMVLAFVFWQRRK